MGQTAEQTGPARIYVWDRFVRGFHWTLVAAFTIAFLTEDDLLVLHVWAGYLVGALIVLRAVWGVIGPRHARFADFVYPPAEVWAYLAAMLTFRARRYLGHNPAGGAMVVALLLVLGATVATGIAADTRAGSQIAAAAPAIGNVLAPVQALADSRDDDRDDDDGERGEAGFVGEVHEVLADLSLILVIAHIAGVLVASLCHRENLVRSMITGWKRA